jgi:hypothetical protein
MPGEPTLEGQLTAFGSARYHHDPKQPRSFFVTLQTGSGERTVWGNDLERALREGVSKPDVGDTVRLVRVGQDRVTVKLSETLPDGSTVQRDVEKLRNRWQVERTEWLRERERLANDLRSDIEVKPGASPDAVNARLAIHQAFLLAEKHLPDKTERAAFVSAVREAFAMRLARGDRMPEVRLREQAPDVAPPAIVNPVADQAISR